MDIQGCHTPTKAKFPVFSTASKYYIYSTTTAHKEIYYITNVHSKPQSQMQQSLLQKLHSIIGFPPTQNLFRSPSRAGIA